MTEEIFLSTSTEVSTMDVQCVASTTFFPRSDDSFTFTLS